MSNPKEIEDAKPPLRRSSRSTRGSVKPIVDLTKAPVLDDTEEEKKDVSIEEEEDVLELSSPNEDANDDDFEVLTTKTKRKSKVAPAKPIPKPDEPNKQQAKTKTTRGTRKSTVTKTADKKTSSKKSSKVEKQEAPEEDETHVEDDDVDFCYELNTKEMKEVNNAFDVNCSDGEELLSSDDLKTAIRSLGFEPRADEIQKLTKKFANKDGKINRNSFHKIMAFKIGSSPGVSDNCLNDEISKVFNLLDLDKTAMITIDNLKSISKELNEEITDEELREMIAEADLDGDFQINKQEFYNIMKKTSLY